jgi:transposase
MKTGRCGMMENAKWALASGLQLQGSECHDGRWTVSAVGRGTARCPGCDVRSAQLHGWQVRHLQDLPAQGTPVTLRVSLARRRCQNQSCERQTFSDRLPLVAGSYARRTRGVADLARLFGHVAGGCRADRYWGLAGFGCRLDCSEFDRRTEMAKRSLVPETGGLRVVTSRWAGGDLVIEVEPREPAQCPRCRTISTSRHSAYIRTLRDLPIQGDAVTLRVHAGRWRCRSSSCVRRTFVAPLTALACARQRRTRRLDTVAFLIGHAMGGGTARAPARRASEPRRHTDQFEACSAVERTERTNARDWHR